MGKTTQVASFGGIVIALGIIYGDIGTSPLYVFNAIITGRAITESLIVGSLSCIIWTITLQTTVKYVILVLRADNRGEGGIFALFTLVKRRRKWLVFAAMIGGAALLADGIITPPITITSAIEGLQRLEGFEHITENITWIVIAILSVFFFLQQFGTASIGKFFGPVMATWFTVLAVLGAWHLFDDITILKAFNPWYGITLISENPGALWILGAVFLCTTGAEALYSDLGHCGKENIRITWVFVKSCLLINYIGQGSSLLKLYKDTPAGLHANINPFYDLMPDWFLLPGIILATTAAIVASQAMISGAFTLIGEAMRLNLWPRLKIRYPSEEKGQLFIPMLNLMLYIGCVAVVLYFQTSSNMEAAYGLAIIVTMLMTTILFANYLVLHRSPPVWIWLFMVFYLFMEGTFLVALMQKFKSGGYFTVIIGLLMFSIMYIWYRSRKIKNRYVEFVRLEEYLPMLQALSNDTSVNKYATHLVYLTSANSPKEIEHKIMYSIFNRKPKRADIYWFVHVDTVDDPYTCEYEVITIIPDEVIKIDFRLGFRIQPRINLMFKTVVENMVANNEVNITSRYESLQRNNVVGDFEFIVMEKYLSADNALSFWEFLIMKGYFAIKEVSITEEKAFGLDASNVKVEKFPLIVAPLSNLKLKRTYKY